MTQRIVTISKCKECPHYDSKVCRLSNKYTKNIHIIPDWCTLPSNIRGVSK